MSRTAFTLAILVCVLNAAEVFAQPAGSAWPSRQVRMIVPFATGGPTDIVARVIAQKLFAEFNVPFIVDNRSGGGGVIGSDAAAKSPPDGYTLLVGSPGTMAINPALLKDLPYSPTTDLIALSHAASFPHLLAVHSSLPVKNVRELIALAKSKPDSIMYASSGVGSTSHLEGAYLANQTGTRLNHVPYRGGSLPLQALLSGEVMMTFDALPIFSSYLQSGRIRVLGVSTAKRSPSIPQIPTLAESGVPGFDLYSWVLFAAPKGLPPDVAARINAAIAHTIHSPEMKARFADVGADPVGSDLAGASSFLQTELAKWKKIVEISGAKTND